MINTKIGRHIIIGFCSIFAFSLILSCLMPPAFADEAKGTQSVNVTVGDRRVTPLQPAKEKQPGLKVSLFSGESTVIRMPANMPRPGRVNSQIRRWLMYCSSPPPTST
jgi:hypothetical protein